MILGDLIWCDVCDFSCVSKFQVILHLPSVFWEWTCNLWGVCSTTTSNNCELATFESVDSVVGLSHVHPLVATMHDGVACHFVFPHFRPHFHWGFMGIVSRQEHFELWLENWIWCGLWVFLLEWRWNITYGQLWALSTYEKHPRF